jgi:serine/threonine protein kinase
MIEYYEKNFLGFKNYLIIDVLGKSFFGKVFKVMYKKDKKIYAMKVLNKERIIKKNFLKNIKNEMEVLKKNKNIFLVNLYQTFQTPNNLYFIFEYCEGNDLDFYIENKKLFNEDEIKFIMSELIEAIEFLHKNGVIIKDLKPENILIDSEGHFKINTFSLNKYFDLNSIENINNNNNNNNDNIINMISNGNINNNINSINGTLIYLAPEILNKEELTFKADIYCLGCIIYELFTGNNLYNNIKKEKIIEEILNKDFINKQIDLLSEKISENLKNLLKKMLEKDVEKRFNLEDIKSHEFFIDVKWEEIKEKKNKIIINLNEYRKKNLEKEKNEFNKINEIEFDDNDYTENNKNIQRIRKFTYIEGEENEEKDF